MSIYIYLSFGFLSSLFFLFSFFFFFYKNSCILPNPIRFWTSNPLSLILIYLWSHFLNIPSPMLPFDSSLYSFQLCSSYYLVPGSSGALLWPSYKFISCSPLILYFLNYTQLCTSYHHPHCSNFFSILGVHYYLLFSTLCVFTIHVFWG
jgi:hypothetical protein